MVHWSFCLTCEVFHLFLKYPLLRDIVILTMLLIFSYAIFMYLMFLSLCQSAIKEILRNVSLLNVRLPGLLPRVECIAALMACIAMDKDSSMYFLSCYVDINNVYSNGIINGYQIVLIFGVNHIFGFLL